ncbi:MAG: DUF4230 domain-containing protein [Alkalispirochaeta sp.]
MNIRKWFSAILIGVLLASAVTVSIGLRDAWARVDQQRLDAAHTQVKHLQTLVTTRYRYRDVVFFDRRTRVLGIPAGQQEVLFSVEMEVTAGIDLSEGVEITPDRDNRRGVYVTLPSPAVLRVVTDEASIRQYLVLERFGRLDWLDISEEIQRAKDRNRQDAVERGILSRAELHTRTVIDNLLRNVGYETVEVRFRPAGRELHG